MAVILALIALGTLFSLIIRAAKKAPQEYVDLMIMTGNGAAAAGWGECRPHEYQ